MAKKKLEDSLEVALDGRIFLIETTKGKKTETELDGMTMLRLLVDVIEKAITNYANKVIVEDNARKKLNAPPKKAKVVKGKKGKLVIDGTEYIDVSGWED
jgi:hypothetical protein